MSLSCVPEAASASVAPSLSFQLTPHLAQHAFAYWIDACERQILLLDVQRQRGNNYYTYLDNPTPSVLQFDSTIMIDGRDLLNPVNYLLLRIIPPSDVETDPTKRPFVVFDPRAGNGPGIGGMKRDSEIGLALMDGHPVYFVSFLPTPITGQTSEDVCSAEAHFVSKVIEWHPDAGQPCLIGNCQAGWQIALMSAMHPSLPSVLILAGAPMSFWAGIHGVNPMRYAGGMTGGSWSVALASDIGGGLYDGAHLIDSFEKNNPANTYWKKEYTLYSKIDTEGPRYLEFEKWWSTPSLLGREEIQFIVDDLFIGNNLVAGKIRSTNGMRANLRNIKSPIVVFCSNGDDISSPQQALGWILDIYGCDDDIIASEQTIIYSRHHKIGHLGIFVSSSVADKELQKFISNIDMIEMIPPGLYEASFVEKTTSVPNANLASGHYVLRFSKRKLDDIRALGFNDHEDDLRFAAVARISENLQGLYFTFVSPFVRAMITPDMAETIRQMHPLRLKPAFFSDRNPFCAPIAQWAETIRNHRHPLAGDNFFWQMQQTASNIIVQTLNDMNERKNEAIEALFLSVYGSPLIQAMVGLKTIKPYAKPSVERDIEVENERQRRLLKLMTQIEEGSLVEATIRGLLYVSRADGAVDEREYNLLIRLRDQSHIFHNMTHDSFRSV
ncbi:MAG: DUF3141 domain-containing protein, partial [Alphaproteobacteria bacterium]|nr:DUF3141 domain-containing protein [Alphaproteobacteria bacterium]